MGSRSGITPGLTPYRLESPLFGGDKDSNLRYNCYNTPMLSRDLASYISGYVDGEGCFSVSFSRRLKLKIGWEVKPSFAVGQNYDRAEVLGLMQKYFKCGFIRRDYSDKTLKYEVRSIDDLVGNIIPHFMKFPLRSSKRRDLILFGRICGKIKQHQHLKPRGLENIVILAYRMNSSGRRRYRKSDILKSLTKTKI